MKKNTTNTNTQAQNTTTNTTKGKENTTMTTNTNTTKAQTNSKAKANYMILRDPLHSDVRALFDTERAAISVLYEFAQDAARAEQEVTAKFAGHWEGKGKDCHYVTDNAKAQTTVNDQLATIARRKAARTSQIKKGVEQAVYAPLFGDLKAFHAAYVEYVTGGDMDEWKVAVQNILTKGLRVPTGAKGVNDLVTRISRAAGMKVAGAKMKYHDDVNARPMSRAALCDLVFGVLRDILTEQGTIAKVTHDRTEQENAPAVTIAELAALADRIAARDFSDMDDESGEQVA